MKRNIEKERQVERNKNEQRERGGHSDRKKRRRERRKRMKYLRGAFKRKEKTQPGEGKRTCLWSQEERSLQCTLRDISGAGYGVVDAMTCKWSSGCQEQ